MQLRRNLHPVANLIQTFGDDAFPRFQARLDDDVRAHLRAQLHVANVRDVIAAHSDDLVHPLQFEGSREYADYREQLISETEAAELSFAYQEQAGIPTDAKWFVAERHRWLSRITQETDRSFPENDALRIENGEPVLAKLTRKKIPARLAWLEATIRAEMQQTPILDALADTENLLRWTRFFGPLSGLDTKLEQPRERYLLASFCYGCNLGPSQTARSVQGTDRRQIAWIHQRHICEDALDDAITTVISCWSTSGDEITANTWPAFTFEPISTFLRELQNVIERAHLRHLHDGKERQCLRGK
jgi:hypothetical protein